MTCLGQCPGMAPEHGAPSGVRSRYSEPVAIRVFKVTLPAGKTLFINWNPELLRNGVDVTDVQVDKGVGRCITCVLREIKPNASARYGNEPWKTRLELMLPLFQESESLVPGHGAIGVLHIQDWDHLLVHASPAYPGHSQQRLCLGQCSGMAPDGKGQLVRAFIGRFGG